MLRFSLKAIFALILTAAVVCAVLFAFSEHVRLATLFVGVLAMPGPLASLAAHGKGRFRIFALGGLAAYGAWFILIGIPGGFFAMNHFGEHLRITLSDFGSSAQATLPGGFGGFGAPLTVPGYLALAWLYAPWFIVLLAGASAVAAHALGSSDPRK